MDNDTGRPPPSFPNLRTSRLFSFFSFSFPPRIKTGWPVLTGVPRCFGVLASPGGFLSFFFLFSDGDSTGWTEGSVFSLDAFYRFPLALLFLFFFSFFFAPGLVACSAAPRKACRGCCTSFFLFSFPCAPVPIRSRPFSPFFFSFFLFFGKHEGQGAVGGVRC